MAISLEQKIAEVENAGLSGVWRKPDTIIIDNPNWFQITTPSSKMFWRNGVHRCILSDEEAPQIVSQTIQKYKDDKKGFRWVVGAKSSPPNLTSLLKQNGMKLLGTALGMVAEIDKLKIEISPKVTVEPVTLDNVHSYVDASVSGWGNSKEAAKEILADMIFYLKDPQHETLYFLARYNGTPAGTAALLPLENSGYLIGGSVDPQFRGKGLYKSLVAKRLDILKEKNLPLAVIQAKDDTSAPICSKLGFETVSKIEIYVYEPENI